MQPPFLHRISVVHVYLYIAATTPDPAGWDLCQLSTFLCAYQSSVLSPIGKYLLKSFAYFFKSSPEHIFLLDITERGGREREREKETLM